MYKLNPHQFENCDQDWELLGDVYAMTEQEQIRLLETYLQRVRLSYDHCRPGRHLVDVLFYLDVTASKFAYKYGLPPLTVLREVYYKDDIRVVRR